MTASNYFFVDVTLACSICHADIILRRSFIMFQHIRRLWELWTSYSSFLTWIPEEVLVSACTEFLHDGHFAEEKLE
jgi:hypothetical protein